MTELQHGRRMGLLLLIQMASALIIPFVILRPPMVNFPDYLPAFAANASLIRTAVFVSFFGAILTVALGANFWPLLSRHSKTLAIAFVAICAISGALDIVQDGTVMSMLSMSERYAQAWADTAVHEVVGAAVASARRWAHYTQLFGFAAWLFTFYYSLFRYGLVPRVLAGVGMLCVLSQFVGVTLFAILGVPQLQVMAMPLAPVHIITALWLIVKGFSADVAVVDVDEAVLA